MSTRPLTAAVFAACLQLHYAWLRKCVCVCVCVRACVRAYVRVVRACVHVVCLDDVLGLDSGACPCRDGM